VLVPVIVGGLLIAYSVWWVYFDRPVHDLLTDSRKAFVWGYGHYLVFAAVAAVGAGLAVAVDHATRRAKVGEIGAAAAVAIPVAIYLLCVGFLHDRPEYRRTRLFGPIVALMLLLTPFAGHAVLLTGLIVTLLVVMKRVMLRADADQAPVAAPSEIQTGAAP
jgi:low temperature requirement protein LtrA